MWTRERHQLQKLYVSLITQAKPVLSTTYETQNTHGSQSTPFILDHFEMHHYKHVIWCRRRLLFSYLLLHRSHWPDGFCVRLSHPVTSFDESRTFIKGSFVKNYLCVIYKYSLDWMQCFLAVYNISKIMLSLNSSFKASQLSLSLHIHPIMYLLQT